MKIAVAGSIAIDILMHFPGRFTEQFVEGGMHQVSLSFLVDEMAVHKGGCGANIAYGMAQLGTSPLLVGAVGQDFHETYRGELEAAGVSCWALHTSDELHTARCTITTDDDANQIVSFYGGAMSEAGQIDLEKIHSGTAGGLDLVLISPDDPAAMTRHTDVCRRLRIPFVADPSQQLARMDGPEIRQLLDGAAYLITNAYEAELMSQKTGWTADEIASRVDVRIVTLGADGVEISRRGETLAKVPAATTAAVADPTGVGDAFRAGYFTARAQGLDHLYAAEVGSALAAVVLETSGTQEYRLTRDGFTDRLRRSYGDDSVTTITAAFGW